MKISPAGNEMPLVDGRADRNDKSDSRVSQFLERF